MLSVQCTMYILKHRYTKIGTHTYTELCNLACCACINAITTGASTAVVTMALLCGPHRVVPMVPLVGFYNHHYIGNCEVFFHAARLLINFQYNSSIDC